MNPHKLDKLIAELAPPVLPNDHWAEAGFDDLTLLEVAAGAADTGTAERVERYVAANPHSEPARRLAVYSRASRAEGLDRDGRPATEPARSPQRSRPVRVQAPLAAGADPGQVLVEFDHDVGGRTARVEVGRSPDELHLVVSVTGDRTHAVRLLRFVARTPPGIAVPFFVGLHPLGDTDVGRINLGAAVPDLRALLPTGWELDRPVPVSPADLTPADAGPLERSLAASEHPADRSAIGDALAAVTAR